MPRFSGKVRLQDFQPSAPHPIRWHLLRYGKSMTNILNLIERHERRLNTSINLVASENLLSEDVRRALSSDVAARYCIPPEGERPAAIWDYPNQIEVRQIAADTARLACELFHASYADVRPLSGNQVAQIVLTSLVARGDTVWSVPSDCGGHFATPVIAAHEGLNLVPIPYDRSRGVIDIDAARSLARTRPPKLVFLDASMQLFPHPVAGLRDALGAGSIISYDASHTMGIIAGGAFQSPLQEGADLLHGSTHKTLWGPQKGLITVRDDGAVAQRIADAVVPMFVSNIHVHHVAALGVALEEARDFGAPYALAVIGNAKALAQALHSRGIDVPFACEGFTESHQVLVDLGARQRSLAAWHRLQRIGINTNAISLPFRESCGLRIGVAEATRRGMGTREMETLAGWIAQTVESVDGWDALGHNVAVLSGQFTGLCFTREVPGRALAGRGRSSVAISDAG
jgi:glycine hydroxymethyltransferase